MNKDMVAAVYDPTEYKLVPLKDLGKWVNAIVEDGYGNQPTALIKTIVRFAPNLLTNASLFLYPFTADSDNVMEATEKVLLELLAKRKTADTMVELPRETKGPLTKAFNEIFTAIGVPTSAESAASFYKPPAPPPPTNPFNESTDKALPELHDGLIHDGQLVEAPRESSVSLNFAAPYGAGVKDDSSKPPMHLIDGYALEQLAKVLAFGAEKYAPHNWRKGLAQTRLISAAIRHLSAFNGGQDTDPETGLHHAAHAMCCCMFMVWMSANKPQFDDRYKGDAA